MTRHFSTWATALVLALCFAFVTTDTADARRRSQVDQQDAQGDDAAEARRERQQEAREARRERQRAARQSRQARQQRDGQDEGEARRERRERQRSQSRDRDSSGGGSATSAESCLPGVLKQRLSEIRSRFGRITVVSTHRPGARINGSGKPSYHGSCRAVDFVPPSGKYSAVTNFLYATHEGGVGTYTCMNHIHIDNGPNYRWSKCR